MLKRVLAVMVVVTGLTAPQASAVTPPSDASLLFSLTSPASVVDAGASGITITLSDVDAVHWFTDRPDRAAGRMTPKDLVRKWRSYGFVTDKPNAALVVTSGGKDRTVIVELGQPRVSHDSIVFPAKPTRPRGTALAAHGKVATSRIPEGRFALTSLFIDDADCQESAVQTITEGATGASGLLTGVMTNEVALGMIPSDAFEATMSEAMDDINGAAAMVASDTQGALRLIQQAAVGMEAAVAEEGMLLSGYELITLNQAAATLNDAFREATSQLVLCET